MYRGARPSQLGLDRREEVNALKAPEQLQWEGANLELKLGGQGYSEWGLSTNQSCSSISYKVAENIDIDL